MYDYARYKFFKEQYEEAGIYFKKCKELCTNITPSSFYKIKFDELDGFCAACSSEITENSSLLMQFLYSTQTNYNVNTFIIVVFSIKYNYFLFIGDS